MMSGWSWVVFCVTLLTPVAVYGVCRIVFAAYFKAKANYLRRYFHESDQEKNGDR